MVFFQAEDGIRDLVRSRGLGDVYKRQGQSELAQWFVTGVATEHQRDEFFVKLMVSLYSEELSLIHI